MATLRVVVEPAIAPYDEPFEIQVDGVTEGEAVTVSAVITELNGAQWRSQGEYQVGRGGFLTDPTRVIWSAEPAAPGASPQGSGAYVKLDLTARHGGRTSVANAVRIDPSVGLGIEPDDP